MKGRKASKLAGNAKEAVVRANTMNPQEHFEGVQHRQLYERS